MHGNKEREEGKGDYYIFPSLPHTLPLIPDREVGEGEEGKVGLWPETEGGGGLLRRGLDRQKTFSHLLYGLPPLPAIYSWDRTGTACLSPCLPAYHHLPSLPATFLPATTTTCLGLNTCDPPHALLLLLCPSPFLPLPYLPPCLPVFHLLFLPCTYYHTCLLSSPTSPPITSCYLPSHVRVSHATCLLLCTYAISSPFSQPAVGRQA